MLSSFVVHLLSFQLILVMTGKQYPIRNTEDGELLLQLGWGKLGQSVVRVQSSAVSDAVASLVRLKKTSLLSGRILIFVFFFFLSKRRVQ